MDDAPSSSDNVFGAAVGHALDAKLAMLSHCPVGCTCSRPCSDGPGFPKAHFNFHSKQNPNLPPKVSAAPHRCSRPTAGTSSQKILFLPRSSPNHQVLKISIKIQFKNFFKPFQRPKLNPLTSSPFSFSNSSSCTASRYSIFPHH